MFQAIGALAGAGGGGGMPSVSASSSADGDNTFSNAFNYKTGQTQSKIDTNTILIGAVVLVGAIFLLRK